ncbi:hypothetical protein EMMF5_005978 [Cystobasidiomycetes sp. EMM_F5]
MPQKAIPSADAVASTPAAFDPFPAELFDKLARDSLGSLDASVVGQLHLIEPLVDSIAITKVNDLGANASSDSSADASAANSQLFLARVWSAKVGKENAKPLLYELQKYTTTG